jgi:hypothetical protein
MVKNITQPLSRALTFTLAGCIFGIFLSLVTYQWLWLDLLGYRDSSWDYHLELYLSFGAFLGAELGMHPS